MKLNERKQHLFHLVSVHISCYDALNFANKTVHFINLQFTNSCMIQYTVDYFMIKHVYSISTH